MSSALLRHVWGESPAVDRVWAQVAGMRPQLAGGRPLMVLQAYIDDSRGPNGTFVLAGHVAPAESWAKLSEEWERLLPLAKMDRTGKRRFKMTEMMSSPHGVENTAAFFRAIENHVVCSISYQFNVVDLRRARERVYAPLAAGIDFDMFGNDYYVAFRGLLDAFQAHRADLAPYLDPDAPIDFIFDDQAEKGKVFDVWDKFMASRPPEVRKRFGASPRFEDDEVFLPLQAADLWAGAIRQWGENGETDSKLRSLDFGPWQGKQHRHSIMAFSLTEDQLTENLVGLARSSFDPGQLVFDVRWLLRKMVEGY